jgi:hypothetical protein
MSDFHLPGLDKAQSRQPCRATFLHTCQPVIDARAFARMVLTWWEPVCPEAEYHRITEHWTDILVRMFMDCHMSRKNMEVKVYMQGSEPAIKVLRVFTPETA